MGSKNYCSNRSKPYDTWRKVVSVIFGRPHRFEEQLIESRMKYGGSSARIGHKCPHNDPCGSSWQRCKPTSSGTVKFSFSPLIPIYIGSERPLESPSHIRSTVLPLRSFSKHMIKTVTSPSPPKKSDYRQYERAHFGLYGVRSNARHRRMSNCRLLHLPKLHPKSHRPARLPAVEGSLQNNPRLPRSIQLRAHHRTIAVPPGRRELPEAHLPTQGQPCGMQRGHPDLAKDVLLACDPGHLLHQHGPFEPCASPDRAPTTPLYAVLGSPTCRGNHPPSDGLYRQHTSVLP